MELARVIVDVLGGLGLFLLGMTLMTEGLKTMAGDAIRSVLMGFTRSPLTGVMTGVMGTAVLQSSSATIVATVGFVGAGLLSFPQALGIVFGSSLGTTVTGWLVAIIGFKLQLTLIASVLVFIGAMMRLFAARKLGGLGYALAGFGLIFIGIAGLQVGMDGLREFIDFSRFPADNLAGKLGLVLVGVVFTIVTQSSSAGVVAALTALHTDAIVFDQAASLVVGMNIGTSFTAAAATIGGNVAVRRTGFSHVVYNTSVSSLALFLIAPYIGLWQWLAPNVFAAQEELMLVGFHTAFNILGVLLVLPFVGQFAGMIERLFPERAQGHCQILDKGLLKYPELALTAVHQVLTDLSKRLAGHLAYVLGETGRAAPLADIPQELDDLQEYLDGIHLEEAAGSQWERLLAAIQVVEHLQRLQERCENKAVSMTLRNPDAWGEERKLLIRLVHMLGGKKETDPDAAHATALELGERERQLRQQTMHSIAQGRLELKQGVALMEAARWLHRVALHIERIGLHSRELNYRR